MTNLSSSSAVLFLLAALSGVAKSDLVKMCLYYKAAGHARTDPILSQTCASDHVHTFYGPQQFHPNTTPKDLRDSDPNYSTSAYKENQSLYWHPSIYKVGRNPVTGEKTYELAEVAFSGPYYRWDTDTKVEAFPEDFMMIAGMDPTVTGVNLFSECLCATPCARSDGQCESDSDFFPSTACGEMGIAMAFPTCWDGKSLGDDGDHMSHMRYTLDGTVAGDCPPGFDRRLPQIQLFVRINNYEGGQYTFSDNTLDTDEEVFHADFMNGWEEGALENIIENCEPVPGSSSPDGYNPPCTCDQFLTKKDNTLHFDHEFGRNDAEAAKICPIDTRTYILDEEIEFGDGGLPRGSCTGTLIEKVPGVDPPFVDECGLVYTPNTFDEGSCEGGDSDDGSGDGSGDESEDENGDGSGDGSADENEDESEDGSGDENEDESEDGSGDENEDESEDGSGDGEDDSEDGSGDDEDESGDESGDESEEEECADVNKFVWKVTKKGKKKHKKCKWVQDKLEDNKKFCKKKKTKEGVKVSEYCPKTCGLC